MRRAHRAAIVAAGVMAWMTAAAAPALADPAGPTDYQTEVISVEPAVDGFRVEVIGGDSFILIEVEPGTTLEVVGYRGEPYIRMGPDGTVEENQASPTTYLNIDRYGIADIPAGASADAEPDWHTVATDGSYAWHDHRAHWMNEARPPGRAEGDIILEGVVPLVVDGTEVDVVVQSVWQPSPSMAPVLGGMWLGLAVLVAAALLRARLRTLAVVLAAVGLAAATLGLVALFSVPPETSPPWSLWVPPIAATALAVAAVVFERRASTAALLGALFVAAWAFLHREWMWRAVLPTDSPFWVERFVTGAAMIVSVGLVALIGRAQVLGEAD